jgi:Fe-S cluster biogenesis protein NfuA
VSDVLVRIDAALARIRPAILLDGGDISFVGFDDGVLRVALSGACSGCNSVSSTMTLGVERVLKSLVPEVKQVESQSVDA